MPKLFGTDGIRGRANCYPIVPEVALKLGKGIANVLRSDGERRRKVLIGKDTRLSGYMLESALTSGLVSMGMDVLLAGPCPTPAIAHLTRSMNAAVGIMLTASHNPYEDNGVKLFDSSGYKLSTELQAEIEAHVLGGTLETDHIRTAALGKAVRVEDARGRYIEFAKSTIENCQLKGLKILLDCANGAAYQIAPWIFRELGADVIETAVNPDGYNINRDCGALNPGHISSLVTKNSADVGVALDGDGDRVILCDSSGQVVDGDAIMAMLAVDLLERGGLPHNAIVATAISNMGLHTAMHDEGIEVITTPVGDQHVVEKMRAGGYILGGEKCGHLVLGNYSTTGDGIVAALQVLRLMKERDKTLTELATCIEEYPQNMVSLRVRDKPPFGELPELKRTILECEQKLNGAGRVLVRYSGTEPKIRILVEAREAELVRSVTPVLVDAVRNEIGEVTP